MISWRVAVAAVATAARLCCAPCDALVQMAASTRARLARAVPLGEQHLCAGRQVVNVSCAFELGGYDVACPALDRWEWAGGPRRVKTVGSDRRATCVVQTSGINAGWISISTVATVAAAGEVGVVAGRAFDRAAELARPVMAVGARAGYGRVEQRRESVEA